MSYIALLFNYQETRRRLLAVEDKIAGLESALNMGMLRERLQKIRKEMASCQEAISFLQKEVKKYEDEGGDLAEHRRQAEAALYGGRVSSPKELSQLERKINEYKRKEAENEERLLLDLLDLEKNQDKLVELEESRNKLGRKLAKVKKSFLIEQDQLVAEAKEIQEEIRGFEAVLPTDLQERFARMTGKMGLTVIVEVREGICGGCHQVVSPALLERLKKEGPEVITCENCGRLLYI